MSSTIAKRMKEAMDIRKMRQTDLVQITQIGKSSISTYLSGEYDPKQKNIYKIAKALNVSEAWLMGYDVPMERKKADTVEIIPNMKTTKVKVYGSVPAGVPIEAIEDIQGTVDIPSEWLSNGYDYMGIIVKGSSMYPKYMEGDIVVIRVQPDCENGQDCVVYVNGDEATLKKVIKNTDCIVLQPLNPEYTPIVIDYNSEDFKILGVVVQLVRYVWNSRVWIEWRN